MFQQLFFFLFPSSSFNKGLLKRSDSGSTIFYGNISVCIPSTSVNAIFIPPPSSSSSSSSSSSTITTTKRKRTGRIRNNTPISILNLLRTSVQPDTFDPEDNQVYSERSTLYEKIPSIVFIHVNRTCYTATGVKKIQGHVNFPLDGLDIVHALTRDDDETSSSSGTSSSTSSSSSSFSSAASSSTSSSRPGYQLHGFVVHHGRAMNQGHFTAYARVENDWYHFNDHRVTKVKNINVLLSQQVYLLVYQQKKSFFE